jgi:hypothetical protein
MEVHIQGYVGKFYCPRMATMNKPIYAAITTHSPDKPTLIFTSSRRQTRLTALDLIAYAAADAAPAQWLNMNEDELEIAIATGKDASLKHTLQFGIGLHHAGLADGDRELVERLFCLQKIMVLVATSTLAWGVNTPAHLVILKGTEYFDAPSKRCVSLSEVSFMPFVLPQHSTHISDTGCTALRAVRPSIASSHSPKKDVFVTVAPFCLVNVHACIGASSLWRGSSVSRKMWWLVAASMLTWGANALAHV